MLDLWRKRTAWGRTVRRRISPEMEAIIRESKVGFIDPRGFREGAVALLPSVAAHNPYIRIALGIALPAVIIVFNVLAAHADILLWFGILLSLFFAPVVFFSIAQLPGWHKARRNVREYASRSGEEFPLELRWYF